ncbi:MAG: polysaccharide deacetylase family protein [Bacteroidales bacterium]|nr:polysaccharide deacetylase family protein [Bacteroidales bacterium]
MNTDWIIQPPEILRRLFPNSLWRLDSHERREIAFTFDDGPVPEQTPWVLDILAKYGIKAAFFCVGDNVRKYPEIFERICAEGHIVGNHTFNHLQLLHSGWSDYRKNIDMCNDVENNRAHFFRAPHGQITPWRARQLTQSGQFQKIVFWDVMPKDYDRNLTPQQVFDNINRYARNGSIIVMHDSIKAGERMRYALEKTINEFGEKGFSFVPIA